MNVARYFNQQLKTDHTKARHYDGEFLMGDEIPINSVCGEDCMRCINATFLFLENVSEALVFTPELRDQAIEGCLHTCEIYIYG